MKTEAQSEYAALTILKGDDLYKLKRENLVVVDKAYLEKLKADNQKFQRELEQAKVELKASREITEFLLSTDRINTELASYGMDGEKLQQHGQETKDMVGLCLAKEGV